MKMRKILATLAAAVVACSAMVTSAFAADASEAATKLMQITKVTVTTADGTKDLEMTGTSITMNDSGIRINVYNPWANGNKDCMAIPDLKGLVGATKIDVTVKVTGSAAVGPFKMYINGMTNDKDNDINSWAGSDPVNCTTEAVSVDKDGDYVVSIVMAEGKAWSNDTDSFLMIGSDVDADKWAAMTDPAAEAEKPADSTKPAESTADSTKPADDSNKPTGATAGLALAGLAIAGAAVVATKKSK